MKNITTTEEFNSVIQSEQPVIVKFEAGWCPDCKAMDMWMIQSLTSITTINGIL